MQIQLEELSFDNIHAWPVAVKGVCLLLVSLVTLGLGYWFHLQGQLAVLEGARQQETKWKQVFEEKQQQASNLEAYQQQLQEMHDIFQQLLSQLPTETEVPGLLEDISQKGISLGLRFSLFDPLEESDNEFYTELPIKIQVVGAYQQLALFISEIAKFSRIVTVHDVDIQPRKSNTNRPSEDQLLPTASENLLSMTIIAKTYRYREVKDNP